MRDGVLSRRDESRQKKYSRSQKKDQQLWGKEKRGPHQSALQSQTKNYLTKQYWTHASLTSLEEALVCGGMVLGLRCNACTVDVGRCAVPNDADAVSRKKEIKTISYDWRRKAIY